MQKPAIPRSASAPTASTWQTVTTKPRRKQLVKQTSTELAFGSSNPKRPNGPNDPTRSVSSVVLRPDIQQQTSRVTSTPRSSVSDAATVTSKSGQANKGYLHMRPTSVLLEDIARDIPKNSWRWVFRELMNNLPKVEIYIQAIENNYEKDLGEQKFQALRTWLDCKGDKASVEDLDNALRKHDCSSVADAHTWPILQKTSVDSVDGASIHKDTGTPLLSVRHSSVEEADIQVSQHGNTFTFSIPRQQAYIIPKQGNASSQEDKSQIANALLAKIIDGSRHDGSRHSKKIKYSTLAHNFDAIYGRYNLKFRYLGVGKLKTFIVKSNWFNVEEDSNGELYVSKKSMSPSNSFSNDSGFFGGLQKQKGSLTFEDSDSENEYGTCLPSIPETPYRTPPLTRRFSNQMKIEDELGFEECITVDLLENLLHKPKSKCLKFVLEEEYTDKRRFSHDIVSLWNTPDRDTSYIVVGVSVNSSPPHHLIGVKDVKHDRHYQSLFLGESFSYKPPYKYSEILYEGNRYGVITIPSSRNCGNPCYAEKNDHEGLWHQENICYCCHKTMKNMVALREATRKIIIWFGDSTAEDPLTPKKTLTHKSEEEWEFVQSQFRKLSGNMIPTLIVSRCNPDTRYLGSLGKFPWAKVWDFDPQSQKDGVLNACNQEGMVKKARVTTCTEPLGNLQMDEAMDWVLVRGSDKDKVIHSKDPREWYAKVKTSLNGHCQQLAQDCQKQNKPLLVVVLWYDNFQHIMHLARLLQKIDDDTEDAHFVLIMPHLPTNRAQSSSLENLRQQVGIEHVPLIPLSLLCQKLYHCPCPYQAETNVKHMLPIWDGTYDANINDTDMRWYKEEMDILSSEEHCITMKTEYRLGETLFGCGLFEWTDYELGMVDVKRSLYKPLMQKLIGSLRKLTSVVITLFHEPSSGGTTLGRRLLWDLHLMYPCVCLSSNTFQPSRVLERLASLHQKTQLPLVVLIDGAEPRLVKELESSKRFHEVPIVILHVQQDCEVTTDVKVNGRNQFWLTGKVDHSEALALAHVYSHHSSEDSRRKLKMLVEEVKEGNPHYMFEFRQ